MTPRTIQILFLFQLRRRLPILTNLDFGKDQFFGKDPEASLPPYEGSENRLKHKEAHLDPMQRLLRLNDPALRIELPGFRGASWGASGAFC